MMPLIVFTGATSRTARDRMPRGEAEYYRERAMDLGVPADAILVEPRAGCACRATCTCCATASPGNYCPQSWGSARARPAGGASSAGSGPESWPRRRPEALLGDKGYDYNPNRDELRKRRILPVISRKGSPNINGLGTLRYVVEQTFALLHQFKRLAVRWERRTELHNAFASLACSLICRRRLEKTSHDRHEL